jgi:drug/metabolite transporter (DMT)-like permease
MTKVAGHRVTLSSTVAVPPRRKVFERVRRVLRMEMTPRRVLVSGGIALGGAAATLALVGWRRSSVLVHTPVQIGLVALAGACVAVADTLIKRVAATSASFSAALSHPMMLLAVALYLLQILLVAYVFVMHWDFSTVGFSQMVVYGATVVFVGTIIFQERLTLAHWLGLALALAAALLMSA